MRARAITIIAVLVAGLGGAALAACELNPQPLPPSDPNSEFTPGGSETGEGDSGSFSGGDAGSVPVTADAGVDDEGGTRNDDAGDGGDGGDGGDAAAEAAVGE